MRTTINAPQLLRGMMHPHPLQWLYLLSVSLPHALHRNSPTVVNLLAFDKPLNSQGIGFHGVFGRQPSLRSMAELAKQIQAADDEQEQEKEHTPRGGRKLASTSAALRVFAVSDLSARSARLLAHASRPPYWRVDKVGLRP